MPATIAWLTLADVAVRLDVSIATLNRWIRLGEGPPSYKVGRSRRFDPDELDRWLAAQQAAAK